MQNGMSESKHGKNPMNKVGIIDYGAGNMGSVQHAIEYAGAEPVRVTCKDAIMGCDRLILPGVGAAPNALQALQQQELIPVLQEVVIKNQMPFLGICLGMQLLSDTLFEFGQYQGLGWIPGQVVPLKKVLQGGAARIPHMGWNTVEFSEKVNLFKPSMAATPFYFSHSYVFCPTDPNQIAATVNYGGVKIVAALHHKNIFATQFHPEKSQTAGIRLIKAFLNWTI